jgi:hypothetical protein
MISNPEQKTPTPRVIRQRQIELCGYKPNKLLAYLLIEIPYENHP